MDDEQLWKRRFMIFMAARLAGLLMLAFGVVIALSDLVREGGSPLLGAFIALLGGIDAVFAPKMLKKVWEQEDQDRR